MTPNVKSSEPFVEKRKADKVIDEPSIDKANLPHPIA
jgi:hypothetical protein